MFKERGTKTGVPIAYWLGCGKNKIPTASRAESSCALPTWPIMKHKAKSRYLSGLGPSQLAPGKTSGAKKPLRCRQTNGTLVGGLCSHKAPKFLYSSAWAIDSSKRPWQKDGWQKDGCSQGERDQDRWGLGRLTGMGATAGLFRRQRSLQYRT